MKRIIIPQEIASIKKLKAGEEVGLSGIIYTARDQAHSRLAGTVKKGESLPLRLKDAVVYYCGATPAAKGKIIGSCGPTTSRRMDEFTPLLIKSGLKAMIGKGGRCEDVRKAIKEYGAVYFVTYAGCGALLNKYVKKRRLVAYPDLGPEAIYELEIEDFPVIVGIDSCGRSIY